MSGAAQLILGAVCSGFGWALDIASQSVGQTVSQKVSQLIDDDSDDDDGDDVWDSLAILNKVSLSCDE